MDSFTKKKTVAKNVQDIKLRSSTFNGKMI